MKHPQPAFGLLWALLLVPARAESQDRMWFPDQQVSAGAKAEKFFLHASHEFDLTGFSISVRYLPAELQVTAVSTAGTSIEELPDPLGFWNGRNNAVKGEIGYGAVFDLNPPLTSVLPPSPDRTLVRISADVLAAPGGSTTLELKDGLGDASPIFNVLVDPTGHSIRPVLQSGTITVESPPLLAEAGPDQFAPESSVVTLDGSASRSSEDLPLTYAWNQVAGPPAQLLTDSADPQPQYALPALGDGDVALVFELTVSDGLSQAVDRTTVTAVDRDLRRGVFKGGFTGGVRLIDGGARAIVFQGELSWGTSLEDGEWSSIRFTASGEGDESALLTGATLYLDLNASGSLDAADVQLGLRQPILADDGKIEFTFSELLIPAAPRRFLLVADLAPAARSQAGFLFPGLLIAAALALFLRLVRVPAGRYRRRTLLAARLVLAALCALSFSVAACSHGGGGGGTATTAPPPKPSRQVRFGLVDDSDVVLTGKMSGIEAAIDGLPLPGEPLEL